ncbi:MAG: hypothetical protein C0510_11010 [Erythrobacter sp.]|nr:hypothetical protein [Erythrobacter sp.]
MPDYTAMIGVAEARQSDRSPPCSRRALPLLHKRCEEFTMKKSVLGLSIAVLALGASAIALADHHGGDKGPDADGDGVITLKEVTAHSTERFKRMDTDGNGVIDAADHAERKAGHFARIDADGNGEVSKAEMEAAHEARRAERAERSEQRHDAMFAWLDTDKSGGVSESEFAAMQGMREGHGKMDGKMRGGHGEGRGMHMLKMADSNGDGAVTRAEFDAAVAAHFAKMDKDGSGSLSREEHEAARAAMHERHGQ